MKKLVYAALLWGVLSLPSSVFALEWDSGGGATTVGGGGGIAASDNINFTGVDTFQSSTTFNGTVAVSSGLVIGGSAGTSGNFLTSGGSGAVPAWSSYQTYTVIGTSVIATSGYLEFTSIPATYDDLIVEFFSRSNDNTNNSIIIEFNGDTTTTDYLTRQLYHTSGGVSHVEANNNTIGSTTLSGISSQWRTSYYLHIPNYTDNTYFKTGIGRCDCVYDGSVFALNETTNVIWQSTSTINQIAIKVGSSAFGAGSTARLIGVKH